MTDRLTQIKADYAMAPDSHFTLEDVDIQARLVADNAAFLLNMQYSGRIVTALKTRDLFDEAEQLAKVLEAARDYQLMQENVEE